MSRYCSGSTSVSPDLPRARPWSTPQPATPIFPTNAAGGRIGITNGTATNLPISGLKGTHIICSGGISGKYAKQLDSTLDDGNTANSSMMVMAEPAAHPATVPATAVATTDIDDAASYTVCMGV